MPRSTGTLSNLGGCEKLPVQTVSGVNASSRKVSTCIYSNDCYRQMLDHTRKRRRGRTRSSSASVFFLATVSTILCGGRLPGDAVDAFSHEATLLKTSLELYQPNSHIVPGGMNRPRLALRASKSDNSESNSHGERGEGDGRDSNRGNENGKDNNGAKNYKKGERDVPSSDDAGGAAKKNKKKPRRRYSARTVTNSTSVSSSESRRNRPRTGGKERGSQVAGLSKRVAQLEGIVAGQSVEIRKLREECRDLREAAAVFAQVVELLRQAGLSTENYEGAEASNNKTGTGVQIESSAADYSTTDESVSSDKDVSATKDDYNEEDDIFGSAPASVIDAADAAGAAILAALLAGKQRMLVDVRDAELSRDPDILVQFIELSVLPVAAGLEGIEGLRNRVKIVFPTVSQLLQYRRTMALAGSTDVVALSTLGFDPVQDQDSLVFIVAPSPDDEEGIEAMNELLASTDAEKSKVSQPVVVLNPHMVPVSGVASRFSVVYHLRLLSVQYMTGDMTPEYIQFLESEKKGKKGQRDDAKADHEQDEDVEEAPQSEGEEALEAAMNRAHELGVHHGITRAMVIRAYPRPWHVFVDTSPDSDAVFEVSATFDKEPSQDDVNHAIVECLEGSESEDELVAQQMQAALESGQLNSIVDVVSSNNGGIFVATNSSRSSDGVVGDDEDDDLFYDDFGFSEDSC
mmetsp:Transcript_13071/g.28339  ORF Transcript_13071/g.28339 Transcript_13071/m.28339 type:complete len:688 (+) Transcript_13071:228-2291(+)|eukprot:CAMPEP_0178621596 /NCGR_PEP_ID=MMETSP0698-20121128/5895_1 /TAXON_ID=265572 /ORGANISM="Extubocellulus spinifer, Strain CCMP396" /LENGTH=687 /DNA_ID=CAMNT_0020260635 /DNA_START=185 /DNA_END=2248 /DNA_ORIENTATION=-